MRSKDYKKICELCIPHVREVGRFINGELGNVSSGQIEVKERNSLVSYVDREAEQMLVTALQQIVPEAGFITEEGTVEQGGKDWLWIIDPLDGTSNFLHGIPHFAVSVALEYKGKMKIGIVLDVVPDQCYWAWEDGGAYRDGESIYVSKTPDIDGAIIGTGFPYHTDEFRPLMEALEQFVRRGRGIRRMGAAALDLAYVACGRLDIYYERSLNIWDIAGGAVLVHEAGGSVSDFNGEANSYREKGVLVSNPAIHEDALEILADAYQNVPIR